MMHKIKNSDQFSDFLHHQRYALVYCLSLGMFCIFGTTTNNWRCLQYMRINGFKASLSDDICPNAKNLTFDVNSWDQVFNWTDAQENYVRISFYCGLIVGHVPSGTVSDLFGGKHFFATSILFSGVISLIMPRVLVNISWQGTAAVYFLNGIVQSFPNTAMYTLMASWIPRHEIVFYSCIVHAGKFVGTIISLVTTLLLLDIQNGWIYSFYIWGIASIIAYCILYSLIYSRHYTHPFITQKESQLLDNDIGKLNPEYIPYAEILSHSGVWSLLCGEFGHSWLSNVLSENLRRYLISVVGLPPTTMTLIFFVSTSCMAASIVGVGYFANLMFAKVKIPTIYYRGIFTAIGNLACSFVMFLIPFVGCNEYVITTMISLASTIKGVLYSGVKVNVFDNTRNFAGTMYGVENGFGSAISKLFTSSVVSFICKDNTITQWTKLLWLSLGVSMLTTTLCFIWGNGIRAEWDKIPNETEESREKEEL